VIIGMAARSGKASGICRDMFAIAVDHDEDVSTLQKGLESFERCGKFLGDHQICLVTDPTASEREFRKSQADHVIRLQSQHRRRIPRKHVISSAVRPA